MFLEFFKFSTNQRLTLLIMCSLGFAKGFFPLRFPRKSPRPPCFWRPFGAGSYSGICRAICAKRGREFFGCKQGKGVYLLTAAGGWEFFGCRQGKSVLLPTAEGQEQKNAHPAGGMGGDGRLWAYNWSEADTIRTQCGRVK